VITGFYLWGVIGYMFIKWAGQVNADEPGVPDREVLTWDEVQAELDSAPPAPVEP